MHADADDISVYKVIDNAADHNALPAAMDQVYTWSVDWELSLVANKTKVLSVSNTRSHSTNSSVRPEIPEIVNGFNDLDFMLDEKLSFDTHHKDIVCKGLYRSYNFFKVA